MDGIAFHVLTLIGQLQNDAHYALLISLLIIPQIKNPNVRFALRLLFFTERNIINLVMKNVHAISPSSSNSQQSATKTEYSVISKNNILIYIFAVERIGYLPPKIHIKRFQGEAIFQGS